MIRSTNQCLYALWMIFQIQKNAERCLLFMNTYILRSTSKWVQMYLRCAKSMSRFEAVLVKSLLTCMYTSSFLHSHKHASFGFVLPFTVEILAKLHSFPFHLNLSAGLTMGMTTIFCNKDFDGQNVGDPVMTNVRISVVHTPDRSSLVDRKSALVTALMTKA